MNRESKFIIKWGFAMQTSRHIIKWGIWETEINLEWCTDKKKILALLVRDLSCNYDKVEVILFEFKSECRI